MPKRFQRQIEDFICEKCGFKVKGNGFTNHCPQCLWSKHVDINPGDRQEICQGLMEPLAVEVKNKAYILIQRCNKCGVIRKNKIEQGDNFELILELSGRIIGERHKKFDKLTKIEISEKE